MDLTGGRKEKTIQDYYGSGNILSKITFLMLLRRHRVSCSMFSVSSRNILQLPSVTTFRHKYFQAQVGDGSNLVILG